MQWINVTFVFEGNAPIPICLNASMFAQIIHDPASSTEEVSIRYFYESFQIAFPNMCTFAAKVYSLLITPEESGGVSRAH